MPCSKRRSALTTPTPVNWRIGSRRIFLGPRNRRPPTAFSSSSAREDAVPAAEREERIRQALQLLIEEARERIDSHPLGHLVAGRGEQIDLRLTLPTALRDGQLGKVGRDASEALQEAVQSLLQHSALFQPGRVLCLRCQTAACEHSAPADGRQVFAGWGPAGLPRFADFGQWLLQRRDPRVDLLYREAPPLVTVVVPEAEL